MNRSGLKALLDRRIALMLSIGIGSSITMAAAEAAFAAAMIFLMRALGIVQEGMTPSFLPFDLWPTPLEVAVVLCALGVFRGVAYSVMLSMPPLIEAHVARKLRQSLLRQILASESVQRQGASQTLYLFTEAFPKAARAVCVIAGMIPSALMVAILVLMMFQIEPTSAGAAVIGVGVTGLLVLRLNRLVRKIATQQVAPYQGLVRGLQRVATNWMMICALRLKGLERERLEELNDANARYVGRAAVLGASAPVISAVIGIFLLAFLVVIHSRFGTSSGAEFMSMIYLLVRVVQLLNGLSSSLGLANTLSPFLKEAATYLEQAVPPTRKALEKSRRPIDAERPVAPARTLALEDVTFGFAASNRLVIDGLSCRIEAGTQFGIVGPSGIGKSTLLALLMGVFKPSSGRIRIGDTDVADYLGERTFELAYVGAEANLFEGTLRQNMEYGLYRPVTEQDYAEAFRAARIDGLVSRFKDGIDHVIKDQGTSFSAGERQRLALARALLRKPSLLVLDEFTANLDADTEREIVETIAGLHGRCTTIIVSHKPAVLVHCSQVYDMERRILSKVPVVPFHKDRPQKVG
jgi:ABC-type multidrug transport system fused ATPase/permease subunit